MAERSWFFNSGAGDERRYTAGDFAEYFAQLVTTGVLDLGDNLRVTESGGNSHIDEGYAWINGYMYQAYDGGETLSHAATAAIHIDRIILKLDLADVERTITVEVKQGTATPPALTRAGDVYEISLAQVTVNEAGAVTAVTDERDDNDFCGIATMAKNMQEEWEQFLADQAAASFTPLADFNDHVGSRGVAEHDVATTSVAGFMASEDKTKLDGIDSNANAIPTGLITMWSGSVSTIPSGWALCDGTSGTPDLRDRFIMGATSDGDVGDTGGADAVTLTTAQMPSHGHTGSTNTTGSHTHAQRTVASASSGDPGGNPQASASTVSVPENANNTASNGNHSHTVTVNNTGDGDSHENLPPYYKLAFIMKL